MSKRDYSENAYQPEFDSLPELIVAGGFVSPFAVDLDEEDRDWFWGYALGRNS